MTRIDSPLPLIKTGAAGASHAGKAAGPVTTVTLADSPPNLARMTAGAIIAGVVIGRNQKGLTQVRTDHGALSFRTQLTLPAGTQLILQIQPSGSQLQVVILSITPPGPEGAAAHAESAPPTAGGGASTPAAGGTGAPDSFHLHELARQWPALAEALAALQSGGMAGQVLQALVARPDGQIAPTLLFFMAALTNGKFRDWLRGEIGRALSAVGRRDLVASLSSDLSELSRLANPSDDAEWRTFLLPLDDGGQISQIRFFLKRHRSAGPASQDDPPATRFIFEVDLSRLGSLQFDGLAGSDRFDLMVRSLAPLPQDIRANIAAIFTAARDEGRLLGDIGFQTVPSFAITPLESALNRDAGVVV